MPKYEIGYILSSSVADDDIGGVTAEISSAIEASGGKILNEDHWGRKKLAYPIGRTRNGYYAFVTADLDTNKISEIEHKLRTQDAIIRFLVVNMTEADKRRAKDEAVRSKRALQARSEPKPVSEGSKEADSNLDIDQEIEKALSEEKEKV